MLLLRGVAPGSHLPPEPAVACVTPCPGPCPRPNPRPAAVSTPTSATTTSRSARSVAYRPTESLSTRSRPSMWMRPNVLPTVTGTKHSVPTSTIKSSPVVSHSAAVAPAFNRPSNTDHSSQAHTRPMSHASLAHRRRENGRNSCAKCKKSPAITGELDVETNAPVSLGRNNFDCHTV